MPTEPDPIDEIHRSIVLFSRHARASEMYVDLSFVGYSLLSYVNVTPSPHASDLAKEYGLDKSTVSRQLADLEGNGMLLREPDPDHPRRQRLILTDRGREALAATRTGQRELLEKRLAQWAPGDVAEFSRLFWRFVSEPE